MDKLAREAEIASTRGNLSSLYKITKLLSGYNIKPSVPVLDKSGGKVTTEQQEAAHWVEIFRDVLNRPEPDEPVAPSPATDILNINVKDIRGEEVRNTIKAMNTGKAAGIDSIHADMLKSDHLKSLTIPFQTIWNGENIPSDWTKGLTVKIPKKGNLQKCDNCRGIKFSVELSWTELVVPLTTNSAKNRLVY